MDRGDYIIRTTDVNPEGELWYSQEYVIKQIEMAYQAGLSSGVRVELHTLTPIDKIGLEKTTDYFWSEVAKKYKEDFNNGFVWRIAKKAKFGPFEMSDEF